MSNVLKQRLDRGTMVTIMPCYEVGYRICRYFFSCGAHVLNLRNRSSISACCGREARALRAGDVLFMFLLGEESRMIQMQLGGGRSNVAKDEAKVTDMELCLQLGTRYGVRAARHSIRNLALSTFEKRTDYLAASASIRIG